MNKTFIAVIMVLVFATAAVAGIVSYKQPKSMNEYIQVTNTSAAALGKGAPVVFEASEVVTNGVLGINGADATTSVVIGVLTETLEVGAVGNAITTGIGEVLCDEAVDAGDNIGTTTTAGEADDNNTNAQSMFGVALEASSARGLVDCFIHCK